VPPARETAPSFQLQPPALLLASAASPVASQHPSLLSTASVWLPCNTKGCSQLTAGTDLTTTGSLIWPFSSMKKNYQDEDKAVQQQ
jgi:hypothetical protein